MRCDTIRYDTMRCDTIRYNMKRQLCSLFTLKVFLAVLLKRVIHIHKGISNNYNDETNNDILTSIAYLAPFWLSFSNRIYEKSGEKERKPQSLCYDKGLLKHPLFVLISRKIMLLSDLEERMLVSNNLKSRDQLESRFGNSESQIYREPISAQMMSFFYSHYTVQAALQKDKRKQKKSISIARYQLGKFQIKHNIFTFTQDWLLATFYNTTLENWHIYSNFSLSSFVSMVLLAFLHCVFHQRRSCLSTRLPLTASFSKWPYEQSNVFISSCLIVYRSQPGRNDYIISLAGSCHH